MKNKIVAMLIAAALTTSILSTSTAARVNLATELKANEVIRVHGDDFYTDIQKVVEKGYLLKGDIADIVYELSDYNGFDFNLIEYDGGYKIETFCEGGDIIYSPTKFINGGLEVSYGTVYFEDESEYALTIVDGALSCRKDDEVVSSIQKKCGTINASYQPIDLGDGNYMTAADLAMLSYAFSIDCAHRIGPPMAPSVDQAAFMNNINCNALAREYEYLKQFDTSSTMHDIVAARFGGKVSSEETGRPFANTSYAVCNHDIDVFVAEQTYNAAGYLSAPIFTIGDSTLNVKVDGDKVEAIVDGAASAFRICGLNSEYIVYRASDDEKPEGCEGGVYTNGYAAVLLMILNALLES